MYKFVLLILDSYKRVCLTLFKSILYRLLNNESKIKKYQARYEEQKDNLKSSYAIYKEMKNFILQSKEWVNSKEFKEKYIDTKHPYPPLLNPNSVDYDKISAKLAWELNLPLPPNYDFIFFSNGSSATVLSILFLEQSNVRHTVGYAPKDIYLAYYDMLRQPSKQKTCLFFWSASANTKLPYFNENPKHFLYSLSKKVPMLYIARDPIGRLKHYLNHLGGDKYDTTPLMKRFNLTCKDYEKLFYKPTYVNGKHFPDFTTFEKANSLNFAISQSFIFDSILEHFKNNLSFIHCVEFNDLKPDNVISTLETVTHTFNLNQPQNKDIFLNRINRNCGGITQLPSILYAHPEDLKHTTNKEDLTSLDKKDGFSFIITMPQCITDEEKDFVDITSEIEKDLIIDDTHIFVIIKKQELDSVKQNTTLYNTCITYLKDYVNALKEHTQEINNNLINESQILNYLREHKQARIAIKKMLDSELNYIKTHHPTFIQKWQYYLEFEKMCIELD